VGGSDVKENSWRKRSLVVTATLVLVLSMGLPVVAQAAAQTAAVAAHTAAPSAANTAVAATSAKVAKVTPSTPVSPNPGFLYVDEVAPGGATTEDPAVAYDTVSYEPILNVYEPLVTYNGTSNTTYVPVLATCVPGTSQCSADYGSSLIVNNGLGQPIYWTFVIDPHAKFYDPSTHNSWGVYPSDVMFSIVRDEMWSETIGVGSTAGWLITQALLPNGNSAFDSGIHYPYNTTPSNMYGTMLINDTTYCPSAALTVDHGCITFVANGGGTDWPFFMQLINDGFMSVVPCGWFTFQSAGIPGWSGTGAGSGDGPCLLPNGGTSTMGSAWTTYLSGLSPTMWDSLQLLIQTTYPAPQPNVQWNMVGSGPYYAAVTPLASPPGYSLVANPAYVEPSGCTGADGLHTYPGSVCLPAAGSYIPDVSVTYEPNDAASITGYTSASLDFGGIQTPETSTMVALAAEGKLNYYIAPSISTFFLPMNLNWSATQYATDHFTAASNIPHDFFSGQAARSLMQQSYPYATAESTAWTVDGVPWLYEAGGPIAKGMGNFYPLNVSFPTANPDLNPADVGSAAWWWAQGTNPSSTYYDPELAACVTTTCVFPVVGELGNTGLDTAISEFISEIKTITSNHIQPDTFDLNFGGPNSLISDQLVLPPGSGPLPLWNLGWAPDNFDPQDYMLPLTFPDSTYTYGDAVYEQLNMPAYNNPTACGFSAVASFTNLIHWANSPQLSSECQGVAYDVANYWQQAATHEANLTQRTLDYNLVEHVLNSLALYIWYGQANEVISAAPWIDGSSINYNPSVGGGNDQYWFNIRYVPYESAVTFKESGLPTNYSWNVTAGSPATKKLYNYTTNSVAFQEPNGTLPFFASAQGYLATKASGPTGTTTGKTTVSGAGTTVTLTFAPIAYHTIFFNESGLAPGSVWGITITWNGKGPTPPITTATNTTTTASIQFTLPKGVNYKWVLSVPVPNYKASPFKGAFALGAKDKEQKIKFKLLTGTVTFKEIGLKKGAPAWDITISGANGSFTWSGTKGSVSFKLTSGTYTYTISVPAGYTTTSGSGSFTVVEPKSQTVKITFTAAVLPAVLPPWTLLPNGVQGPAATAAISGRAA